MRVGLITHTINPIYLNEMANFCEKHGVDKESINKYVLS